MKTITVISGKGGTGKTSLVASFVALSGGEVVSVDGDVDAANLSLLLKPFSTKEYKFSGSKEAFIDTEKCNRCDLCRELCRFDAITEGYCVETISCEGCSLCYYACPREAVKMESRQSGNWYISQTNYGTLIHARLGIAEDNSGKLVTLISKKARELAGKENKDLVIIDGPPGIGCPVIAALAGVDVALVVTEPTLSGIHDMARVLAVCKHFGVPALVCINRYDLDEGLSEDIDTFCCKNDISIIGKLPLDNIFVKAVVSGIPVTEYGNKRINKMIATIWQKLLDACG